MIERGSWMPCRLSACAIRQIQPSLGHRQQVRAIREARRGVCKPKAKQSKPSILVTLDHGVDLQDCPEIARRSCRRDQVLMPPLRGGSS
jgi:hypothetical protein